MFSLLDDFFTTPFVTQHAYGIRPTVYVIPESEYAKLQERQNAQQVERLEARKADYLGVVEQLEKQIAELQPALPAAEQDKELAAAEA
ncbi:MAG: guanylate-binding protein [Prochlorococcus sp.]|jgi:hypothetical protein